MRLGVLYAIVSLSCASYAMADEHQWGYNGEASPEHWAEISTDFSKCKVGKHQSPINITRTKKLHSNLLSFHYDLKPEELVNNGHTVQVNIKSEDDYLIYKGDKYYLKQFHFHTPSENRINNKSFPLEVHFVHADKDGKLLVLAVMAEEGQENTELAKAWSVATDKKNESVKLGDGFNINNFLPKDHGYYHFEGSLTTPPCTEDVDWILLKKSVEVSKEQVKKLTALITDDHNNRPVQPINDREVGEM